MGAWLSVGRADAICQRSAQGIRPFNRQQVMGGNNVACHDVIANRMCQDRYILDADGPLIDVAMDRLAAEPDLYRALESRLQVEIPLWVPLNANRLTRDCGTADQVVPSLGRLPRGWRPTRVGLRRSN